MKRSQHILRGTKAGFKELTIHDTDHVPSWKRPGNDGRASLRADAHVNGDWLNLRMEESSTPTDGRIVCRQTMMTLDKAAAIALRDMLNEAFP